MQGRDGQMEAAGDDTEPLFRPPSKDGKGDGREIASSPAGFEINLDVGEVDAAVDDREQSVGPVDEVQSDGERPIAFDGGDGDDEVLPAGEVSGLGVGENNDGDEEEEDEDDDDDDGDDDDDDGDNDEDDGNDNQFGESNGIAPEARRGTFRRPDRRPWESTPQKWTRPSLSAHGLAYPDMPVSHVRDVAAAAMQQAVGSRTKIKKPSGRMLDLFCRFTHDALRQMADAVGGYARHAGRKTIDDSDVALLFQRYVAVSYSCSRGGYHGLHCLERVRL